MPCDYCEDKAVHYNERDDHLLACGNKTELCKLCNKNIKRVDLYDHAESEECFEGQALLEAMKQKEL